MNTKEEEKKKSFLISNIFSIKTQSFSLLETIDCMSFFTIEILLIQSGSDIQSVHPICIYP